MRVVLGLTLFWAVMQQASLAAEPDQTCAGIWANAGSQPHVGDAYTSDEIPSPNKQSVLSFTEDAIHFSHDGSSPISLSLPINLSLTEVLWAADSSRFAVNVSDASVDGPWRTFIYTIDTASKAPKLISISAIDKERESLTQCEKGKRANLATVALLESKELVIVLEVPSSGACRNRGERLAFRLSPLGEVLERMSMDLLKQQSAKELGCRLR